MRKIVKYCGERDENTGVEPMVQPYLTPPGLFEAVPDGAFIPWTCVRTRPRWEKKLAAWLAGREQAYFLPVLPRETVSGRKRRVSLLPLFPGFVFVRGRLGKGDFSQTGMVAYVLRARDEHGEERLHHELAAVWQGLVSGCYIDAVQASPFGERCIIMQGPLQGLEAWYERPGRQGRMVLQVVMMGQGLAVEVPARYVDVCP